MCGCCCGAGGGVGRLGTHLLKYLRQSAIFTEMCASATLLTLQYFGADAVEERFIHRPRCGFSLFSAEGKAESERRLADQVSSTTGAPYDDLVYQKLQLINTDQDERFNSYIAGQIDGDVKEATKNFMARECNTHNKSDMGVVEGPWLTYPSQNAESTLCWANEIPAHLAVWALELAADPRVLTWMCRRFPTQLPWSARTLSATKRLHPPPPPFPSIRS
jgi:hypothetical protein